MPVDIPKGTVITHYTSKILSMEKFKAHSSNPYTVQLSHPIHHYVNGTHQSAGWASKINNSSCHKNNIKCNSAGAITTLKNISAGQELFMSYGNGYWE
jgi:hypothetical protein